MLPDLDNHIDNWRLNCSSDNDPEEYFDEFKSAMKDYRNEFKDFKDALTQIDTALADIDLVIEDLHHELPGDTDDDDYFGRDSTSISSSRSVSNFLRSIFDDVDL